MAGDWIKMRADLQDDPAVYRIAEAINDDELQVVGRLHLFWSWVDKHAVDGCVDGATSRLVDKIALKQGFAEAMVRVGWLAISDEGISIPNFDRHNGESAKERGLKNARQARWREKKAAEASTSPSTEASTREEKRREEKKEESKTKTPRVPRFDAQAHLVSLGVDQKVSEDWLSLRKKKNLAATQTAFDGVLAEAGKAGMTMDQALRTCCTRGWGGFNADWMDKGNVQGGRSTARVQAISHRDESRAAAANSIGLGAQRHDEQLGYIDAECRFIA